MLQHQSEAIYCGCCGTFSPQSVFLTVLENLLLQREKKYQVIWQLIHFFLSIGVNPAYLHILKAYSSVGGPSSPGKTTYQNCLPNWPNLKTVILCGQMGLFSHRLDSLLLHLSALVPFRF